MTTINYAARFQLLMQLYPLLPQPTGPAGALALLAIANGRTITPSTDDTIARIDAVLGCHWCGEDLGKSPSDDFCRESCQTAWRADQVGADTALLRRADIAAQQEPSHSMDDSPCQQERIAELLRQAQAQMEQRRSGSPDGEQQQPVAVAVDELQILRDTPTASASGTTASEILDRVLRATRTSRVVVDQPARDNLRFRPIFGQLSGAERMWGSDEPHWDFGPNMTGSTGGGKTRQILPSPDIDGPTAERGDAQPDG